MCQKNSIRFKSLLLILAVLISLSTLLIVDLADNYKYQVKSELISLESLAQSISKAFTNHIENIWIIEEVLSDYLAHASDRPDLDVNNVLSFFQEKQPGIVCLAWLDMEGNVIGATNEKLKEMSFQSMPFIQEIKSGKVKVVTDLIQNICDSQTNVIIAVHEIKAGSQLKGMTAAVISTDELEYRLPDTNVYRNKTFVLVDRNGMIAYSSDIKATPKSQESLLRDETVVTALNGQMTTDVKKRYVIDNTLRIDVDYPIPEIGWDLKISSPYNLVLVPYFNQLYRYIFISVLCLLLLATIYLMLDNKLLKPVIEIKSTAKKIMDGDYSARTNIKNQDEIGQTANTFDRMAESIEERNETLTQFFTNISHELKTPINVIFASVQLIESYKLTQDLNIETYHGKVDRQMKIIRQNCYRIIRLVSNLIDISRHDNGFLLGRFNNVDLVKLLRDITRSVERYVEAKGIKLFFETEVESRVMACDPDMIERIMLNLISNAVKFTEKNGAITVRIKEQGSSIILSVEDTGIGIPKDKLNTIFERFKQVEHNNSCIKEGSGIGLFLVNAFVDAHGGTIEVVSEEGRGTAFHIRLPVRTADIPMVLKEQEAAYQTVQANVPNKISRIHIEFSDIYTFYDEEIS